MKYLLTTAFAAMLLLAAAPSMASSVQLTNGQLDQVTAGATANAVNGTRVARAVAVGQTAVVKALASTTGSSATSNSAAVVSE